MFARVFLCPMMMRSSEMFFQRLFNLKAFLSTQPQQLEKRVFPNMKQQQIASITPEQEALIPIVRDEWIRIGLDTTPTNPRLAEAAINLAYQCAGMNPPQKILWFKNPLEAMHHIVSTQELGENATKIAIKQGVINTVYSRVASTVSDTFRYTVSDEIEDAIDASVGDIAFTIESTLRDAIGSSIFYKIGGAWGLNNVSTLAVYAYFDALGIDCSPLKGLWATAQYCGWWWAYKNIAIVTPKPSEIRLDSQGKLHGEGVPTLVYEGFQVYAYHGVRLPEKYGKVHPSNWQAQWLLEEENAELRRVLIQGISYARIIEELQAIELDSWQEYTLIKIDSDVDIEPIYLVKMTCPSTGYIHAMRVPPDLQSAREAISWVNWGVEPEEFSVQT
jgi:hypothetical protein